MLMACGGKEDQPTRSEIADQSDQLNPRHTYLCVAQDRHDALEQRRIRQVSTDDQRTGRNRPTAELYRANYTMVSKLYRSIEGEESVRI